MTCLETVAEYIRSEGLLDLGETVVVGVSGGADSLCLLDMLHKLGYPLVVAHFDHGLRSESADEATFVRELASVRGLDFETERGDVAGERAAQGGSLEAAARQARYRFLLRVAIERQASQVATGHTADDQVETILMNLLRGSGPDGLRGMAPLTPMTDWVTADGRDGSAVQLARPLLCLRRGDTQGYCERHALTPVVDPSNQDRTFLRNRVRHELLGALESYNPGIREALLRTGWIMADVSELLDDMVDSAWVGAVRRAGDSALAIDEAPFSGLPAAVQRRLLRRVMTRLGLDARDTGFDAIERLRRAMVDREPVRLDLPGGVPAERVGCEWVLANTDADVEFPLYPLLEGPDQILLPDDGRVPLAAGWKLSIERLPRDQVEMADADDATMAIFDADQLPDGVVMRPPKAGDRLEPFGMQGGVKLSDVFIDRKVPRRLRGRWPLIAAGDEVLWVVGLRRGNQAGVGDSTRRLALMRLVPPTAA
jgi:tRNA(Ile)-lysidine synthase